MRDNFLGVLPLIREYFDGVRPAFVQAVERRYYPVGRGLMVPFDPPLIYGLGGRIQFPWFSFWRSNPLAEKRLSLFASVVFDVLLQDPDLEDAAFTILDFSAPESTRSRELRLIDAKDIPQLFEVEKTDMLNVFAEGYSLAEAALSGTTAEEGKTKRDGEAPNDEQPDLFDPDH